MRLCNSNLLELLVSLGVLHCTERTKHLPLMHISDFLYISLSTQKNSGSSTPSTTPISSSPVPLAAAVSPVKSLLSPTHQGAITATPTPTTTGSIISGEEDQEHESNQL